MMTFKEYLLESSIMSHDALKQAGRDIDQRQLGKIDGSKPKEKRLSQMDKRRARKAGARKAGRAAEEEENTTLQADMDRYREFANRPEEKRAARPKPKRIQQKAKRDLRRVWGRGQSNPNAKSIGEI